MASIAANLVKASYGGEDVTSMVKDLILEGKLTFPPSNTLFGDPKPGETKELSIAMTKQAISVAEDCGESIRVEADGMCKKVHRASGDDHNKALE